MQDEMTKKNHLQPARRAYRHNLKEAAEMCVTQISVLRFTL